jgi:NADH-quinone oxidoreductase subunit N
MAARLLQDLALLTPEVVLAVTLVVALVADLIFRRNSVVVAGIVVVGMIVTGGFTLGLTGAHASIFSGMLSVDPFAWFFKLVILLSTLFVVVFSLGSGELNSPGRKVGEYYVLLVALTLGIVLMAGASNLLMMYLAIELSSLSSYLLSGYTKEAPDSSEAALKYVIYGSVSSGLMIYGMSIIYGLTGSLGFAEINHALPAVVARGGSSMLALAMAGILTIAGLGYKISAVPFHFWAPDVYEGAPITITALLSVASKAGGFALMIRFFKVTFIDTAVISLPAGTWAILPGFDWRQIIVLLSILTMTIGNLVAIWQNNLKRLLAYSSIAHAGYMLMGLVVLSNDGISAVMLYFVIYLFMNLGAFYVVMLIADKTGSEDVEDYKGLGSRSPFLTVALAVFLISLTGLPPTAGFIGKLYLFAALVNHGWIWLAVVGAINSVIALYYYVRVLRNTFLRSGDQPAPALATTRLEGVIVTVLLVPTILLGLYFAPLVDLAQASVKIFGTP